jgi:hypothetical protein
MTVKEQLLKIAEAFSEEELQPFEQKIEELYTEVQASRSAVSPAPIAPDERRARTYALAGKYKGQLLSSEEFMRWKQEEIDLEEAKFERMFRPQTK